MNEHQINCFLSVVDTGSFSRAAAQMHFSQPAITHQVSSLEKELNVILFLRQASGVELTTSGTAFLPAARRLRAAFANAHASVSQQVDGEIPFVLGVPRAMMLNNEVYQTLMIALMENFPQVQVEVREMEADENIYLDLINGVDCVITMDLGEAMQHRKDMRAYPLFQTRCMVSMGKKNPLYPLETVTAEQLQDYQIFYAQYDRHYTKVMKSCLRNEHALALTETTTPLTATHAMHAGKACLISPYHASVYAAEHIAELQLDKEMPKTCAFFLKSQTSPVFASIAKLIQQMHEVQRS